MEVSGSKRKVVKTESGRKCMGGSCSTWNEVEVDGSCSSKYGKWVSINGRQM